MKDKITSLIKNDTVLMIAVVLAVISSIFSMPKIEYIDFKVLCSLFNLMIIVAAFRKIKVLDFIAVKIVAKCRNFKQVSAALIFITFFASMFVTNDVSLITFVPITLIIGKNINMDITKTVVLQTIAANLGSSFTPMGNPQNIFIYNHYNINTFEFFRITSVIAVLAVIILICFIFRGKNKSIKFKLKEHHIKSRKDLIIYFILLTIILLSVFRIIDYKIAFIITILCIVIMDKELFKEVDYSLLLTFIGFFIFVGNISNMEVIQNFMKSILKSSNSTYFAAIISSQVISNVPATMLLSGFTKYYRELLLGVNIGGLGTLIASLASVISYKFYLNEYKHKKKEYMKLFTLYNFFVLFIITLIVKIVL